jgi:hypothetical protein
LPFDREIVYRKGIYLEEEYFIIEVAFAKLENKNKMYIAAYDV